MTQMANYLRIDRAVLYRIMRRLDVDPGIQRQSKHRRKLDGMTKEQREQYHYLQRGGQFKAAEAWVIVTGQPDPYGEATP
jgi:hypothetical protein